LNGIQYNHGGKHRKQQMLFFSDFDSVFLKQIKYQKRHQYHEHVLEQSFPFFCAADVAFVE
jgi:hypothetical protein